MNYVKLGICFKLQDIIVTGKISNTVKLIIILFSSTSKNSRKTNKYRFSSSQEKES